MSFAVLCFSGIYYSLLTLGHETWTAKSLLWLFSQIWMGSAYLSFSMSRSFHPVSQLDWQKARMEGMSIRQKLTGIVFSSYQWSYSVLDFRYSHSSGFCASVFDVIILLILCTLTWIANYRSDPAHRIRRAVFDPSPHQSVLASRTHRSRYKDVLNRSAYLVPICLLPALTSLLQS